MESLATFADAPPRLERPTPPRPHVVLVASPGTGNLNLVVRLGLAATLVTFTGLSAPGPDALAPGRRRFPRGARHPLWPPPQDPAGLLAPTPVARAAVLRVRGLPRAPDPEASFHLDWIFRDF